MVLDDLLAAATVSAVALAVAVAVPRAILMRRCRARETPLLTLSGLLYTIPSPAMIAALWPVFGLSQATVIVAPAMHALLIGIPAGMLTAHYGRYVVDGFSLQDMPLMLSGVLLVAVSSIVTDRVLALAQYLLTPPPLLLEDDRGLPLSENIVPLVRDGDQDSDAEIVDSVSSRLTTEALQEPNRAVDLEHRLPKTSPPSGCVSRV